ncbi:MAG: S8 family serine peptidase [Rhizobacter sp.]|nr:S8 family serine peptidase [Rhizobacter sp.]
MLRRTVAALSALPLVLAGGALNSASAAGTESSTTTPEYSDGIYVVQMLEPPAAGYTGGKAGLKATKPAPGRSLNPGLPRVRDYVGHLEDKQSAALKAVGNPRTLYTYQYAFNGFSAKLTAEQAAALAKQKGVLAVTKQRTYTVDTSTTPDFLHLSGPGGLWNKLGGPKRAGNNVVIGIIDSGATPESLSFSARVNKKGIPAKTGRLAYQPLAGFGADQCQTGEDWTAADCNNKIVAARYYNAGYGGDAGIDADRPWEFNSARDYNGHGTHTGSTAGGNYRTPTTGEAVALGSSVSGMAPRARIAVYQALWSTEDASTAGGTTSDLVAAIDDAVADGVDVINYSISGTQTNFLDPAEVAFLFAADAGVFVSASAGNSGPTASTVAHPSPWITTVAAGTHPRNGSGSVTLGDGQTFQGASLAAEEVSADLVNSKDVGLNGATDAARLCYPDADNELDPAKVTGKIVVCERGVIARTAKSLAVKQAGGVGMILINTSPSSVNADLHFVPSIHLQNDALAPVEAYAATAGATATIAKSTLTFDDPAPYTASFSSRGPLLAGDGDLLKPDLIAPGQDILAAVAPPGNHGREFDVYSGTSMSAPHVAGLAALLRFKHPAWSPMAIKSTLMTSAYDVLDGPADDPSVIFSAGAGHVDPRKANNTHLVYDSDFYDWLAFLCGTTTGVGASTCASLEGAGYSLDPSDMNTPSVSIGGLAGSQTVTRRITNVGPYAGKFTASVQGMDGVDVKVSPRSMFIHKGETKSFTITYTRTDAALNEYTGGYLTWRGKHRQKVRIPMVVKPVALAAPAEVSGSGDPVTYSVGFGYTGPFSATPAGLIPATTQDGTVADDPGDNFVKDGPGTDLKLVDIPAGTTYARISLFDDYTSGDDDLDLYVYDSSGNLVGGSGSGT